MKKFIENKNILSSLIIFSICLGFRLIEYFILKTDETFFAENGSTAADCLTRVLENLYR